VRSTWGSLPGEETYMSLLTWVCLPGEETYLSLLTRLGDVPEFVYPVRSTCEKYLGFFTRWGDVPEFAYPVRSTWGSLPGETYLSFFTRWDVPEFVYPARRRTWVCLHGEEACLVSLPDEVSYLSFFSLWVVITIFYCLMHIWGHVVQISNVTGEKVCIFTGVSCTAILVS
jgi:hypothetical protein